MQSKSDVVIVGAGPVGLTMAAALNHHGISFRLIEKIPTPTDKSKALVLWSRTLELFDPIGIGQAFLRAGITINAGSIYAHNERLVHFRLTGNETPFGNPLMIPQSETERVLAEHLKQRSVHIERETELVSFSEGADSVICRLRHADGREETVETPWLIGCDGAHSTVRHTAGMNFTGHAEPNDWMLADVYIEGPLARDEVTVFWHAKGVLIFFPIINNRFRMIADLGAADPSITRSDPTLFDVQAKLTERGPKGLTARDPVWLANFRINERKVADYRRGRIMLCGDAAHIHSPAGGQGMNTGMQDAFNLAWKLAFILQGKGQAEPLLQSFSIERSSVGDQVLKMAEQFTTVATLRGPIAQALRNHIAPIISGFQFFQDAVRLQWQELSINYRHSPLSQQHWPSLTGGQHAGDRLCYAPLVTLADGSPTTLFASLDGVRHSLLLLPGDEPDSLSNLLEIAAHADRGFRGMLSCYLILKEAGASPAIQGGKVVALLDKELAVYAKLHATRATLILVRPDGYIGYRCQPAHGEELMKYLDSYLIRDNSHEPIGAAA